MFDPPPPGLGAANRKWSERVRHTLRLVAFVQRPTPSAFMTQCLAHAPGLENEATRWYVTP